MMLMLGNKKMKNKKNKQHYSIPIFAGLIVSLVLVVSVIGLRLANAQSLQQQIDALKQENSNNQNNVNKLREVATSYKDAIAQLEDNIKDKEYEIQASSEKQTKIEADIKQANAELDKQKELLSQNIRSMYIEGDISTIEMLASSQNLSDFIDKQQYRESIKNKISDTLKKIDELKVQLENQKKLVEAEIKTQTARRAELASNRQEKARLLALNQAEQEDYNEDTKKNQAKIAELQAAQAEIERRMMAAAKSGNYVSYGSVKRGDMLGTVGNTGFSFGAHLHLEARYPSGAVFDPAPLISSGQWLRPVAGGYVSQAFGELNSWYSRGYHPGIDFAGVTDRPVLAVADGEIISRGWLGAYGNAVMIKHSDGIVSVYGHMNR